MTTPRRVLFIGGTIGLGHASQSLVVAKEGQP
jgi:hypothetical protein